MASTYKILGQSAPAATTSVDLYTVPAATQSIVSSITISNRGTAAGTFRVSVAIAGAALANAQYIVYDQQLEPKATVGLTLGVSLATTDKIRVYASTADFSFNAFGCELS